jgi:hypothetical protein
MLAFIQNFFIVLFMHYVLDYPMQGSFLAQTKGKYLYSLLAHCMIYGIGIAITFRGLGAPVASFIPIVVFVVGTHLLIDFKKATAKNKELALTTYLYIDQAMHIIINTILIFAYLK